jgi:hypothetical protein
VVPPGTATLRVAARRAPSAAEAGIVGKGHTMAKKSKKSKKDKKSKKK